MKTYTKDEIELLCQEYLYYVGTEQGAKDFIEMDRKGLTDCNILAGTTRVFKFVFKDFIK